MKAWKKFVVALLSIGAIGAIGGVILGAYVVFGVGLRASAEPSRWEVTIARTIRNWAIPGRDRRETNPLERNAANLQAGRDVFRSQCAVCHGFDGRGLTDVGRNLYPRVPDLRSSSTQTLSPHFAR